MKRKIRKEVHVSVEMSEAQSINVRTILFNIQDRHVKEIMKQAGVDVEKHFGNIREDLSTLCYELEIHPGDRE